MDAETTSHIHQILNSMYSHIAVIGLVAGGVIGSVVWVWNQYMLKFATVKAVHELKDDNVVQHNAIIERMNDQHAEVLKTIIEKHNG